MEKSRTLLLRKPATVADLCVAYRNENPHAWYVATLALTLYDAVRKAAGFQPRDRRILEIAALLHDIGYALDPANHVEVGADLVLKHGIRGIRREELETIAEIIRLHSGRLEFSHDAGTAYAQGVLTEKVLRLGAILRVADALDSGHLQENKLREIVKENSMLRIRVASPTGAAGIERAMAKSDLWQRVFPIGIVFEALPRKLSPEPRPTQRADDALRRLMLRQFRILRTSARRAAREDDEEALHDLRIATRSLRRILEAFERPLRKTSAAGVEKSLRRFAKQLGPARDLDVWIATLEKPRFKLFADSAPDFLHKQLALRAAAREELRARLNDPATQDLLSRLGLLLRVELVHSGEELKKPFGPLARRVVKSAWKSVMDKAKWAKSRDAEALHRLRIRIRKLRLLAAMVCPALGDGADEMIRTIHDLERNLGRIHDLDMALIHAEDPDTPVGLREALAKRRRKEYKAFREAWEAWTRPETQRLLRKALA